MGRKYVIIDTTSIPVDINTVEEKDIKSVRVRSINGHIPHPRLLCGLQSNLGNRLH